MIKTLFVPISSKMSSADAFFLQSQGKSLEFQRKQVEERETAEKELDSLLADDWQILHSDLADDSKGAYFVFILHKPNSDFDSVNSGGLLQPATTHQIFP